MPSLVNGKWRGRVRFSGKKPITRIFDTKRAALSWELELKRDRAAPETPIVTGFLTVFNDYLDSVSIRSVVSVYQEKLFLQTRFVRFLKLRFAGELDDAAFLDRDLPITEITPKVIEDFLVASAREVSNNRANKDRKNLKAFFNWVNQNYGFPSPVKIRKFPHDPQPHYVPAPETIHKLILSATAQERVFLFCYLYTAARVREIFRLTWTHDIDLEGHRIRLGSRKNETGEMKYTWLRMGKPLHQALSWWYNTNDRPHRDASHVFVIPKGKHAGKPYQSRRWFMRSLCKRAGIPYFPLGDIRPTVATNLAEVGQALPHIQAQLRHSRPTTTDKYIKQIVRPVAAAVEITTEAIEQLWNTDSERTDYGRDSNRHE